MVEEENILRKKLVEIVYSVGICGLREESLEAGFIAGNVDPQLKEIGIDSLSEMELCIAIEHELRVSIVPAELQKLSTLGNLAKRIEEARRR